MKEEQNKIIKDICKEFECTQIELAEKLGFSLSSVRQWSSGDKKIPNYFYKSIDFIREVRKLNQELKEKYSK
jgi:DNA-binding transcriptional regulator YiaG